MSRTSLRAALPLALAASLACPPARAALVTDVADAADKDNPIDLNLDLRWRRLSQSAKVKREFYDAGRLATIDATELDYSRVTHLMDVNLALGVYHDLEIHANLPFAVGDEQSWGYATVDGASVADKSSLANNRLTPDGACITADCATTRPALVSPGKVFRGGLVDPSIGFAWGLLGNSREDKLPENWFPSRQREATWVLGFDYTMPVAAIQEPHKANPSVTDGSLVLPMGQGTHRLQWSMAMSKRVGFIDPFFKIHYTLPIASAGAYDNCASANADTDGSASTTAMRAVCKDDATFDPGFYWKGKTALQPQHRGGMLAGAEFYPVDDKEKDLRFVIGVQLGADFVSKGRTYTELSDALRRLTYSDQYFVVDGRLTFDLRFSKYLHWTSFLGVGTHTPHFITAENVGKDRYGVKTEDPPDGLVTLGTAEVNPNYDFRFDQPGRRLRVTEISVLSASTALSLTF
jgi:hypothetical protein